MSIDAFLETQLKNENEEKLILVQTTNNIMIKKFMSKQVQRWTKASKEASRKRSEG